MVIATVTSRMKSPALRPAFSATPPMSTCCKHCNEGKFGVGEKPVGSILDLPVVIRNQ